MTSTSWKWIRGIVAAGVVVAGVAICEGHGGHGGGGGGGHMGGGGHIGGGGAHFGGGGGHIGGSHFSGGGMRMGGGGGGGIRMGGGVPRSFSGGGVPHVGGMRGGSIGNLGGGRAITPSIPRGVGGSAIPRGNIGNVNLGNSLHSPRGIQGLPHTGNGVGNAGNVLRGGQLGGTRGIPNLYNGTRTTSLGAGRIHTPQIGGANGNRLGVANAAGVHLPHAGTGTAARAVGLHNHGGIGGPGNLGGANSALRHVGHVGGVGGVGNVANVHRLPYAGNSLRLGSRSVALAGVGYRPSYYRHPWYHGYWHRGGFSSGFWLGYGLGSFGNGWGWGLNPWYGYGGYGRFGYGYGFGGYGYQPFGWGYGGWGLGSLAYGSGYLSYSNPYCVSGYGAGVYDYNQPIPVTYNSAPVVDQVASADPTLAAPAANSSEQQLESAIGAFRQRNYDKAIDTVDKAIAAHPDDAVLHEFRALALFARGDYQQAAATIHSVLAVGPGWDWDTLSSIYADPDDYTPQLRALETYTVKNPGDAASSFLLAYHYLCGAHPEAALSELKTVVRLKPDDRVAAELVKMISTPAKDPAPQGGVAPAAGEAPSALPTPPVPNPPAADPADVPSGPPVAAAQVVGDWSASRGDGSQFQLKLQGDGKFTWTFSNKQMAATSLEGTYTIEGNVLALERKDGGSLIAELTSVDGRKFHFKLAGSPKEDPGLEFQKK